MIRFTLNFRNLAAYQVGAYLGATMLKQIIAEAESAVAHGDTIEMIRQYQALKEYQ